MYCWGFVYQCTVDRQGLSPKLMWHYPVGRRPGVMGDFASHGYDSVPSWAGKAGRGGGRRHSNMHVQCTHPPCYSPELWKGLKTHTCSINWSTEEGGVCTGAGKGGRAEITQCINEIRTRQGRIMCHYTPETKGQLPEGWGLHSNHLDFVMLYK